MPSPITQPIRRIELPLGSILTASLIFRDFNPVFRESISAYCSVCPAFDTYTIVIIAFISNYLISIPPKLQFAFMNIFLSVAATSVMIVFYSSECRI